MSKKSTSKEKFSYQDVFEITTKNEWVSSSLFNIDQCPEIMFQIFVKRNEKKKLTIRVTKSYVKSAIAVIALTIDDMQPIRKYVTNWTNDVIFDNCVIPFNCDTCPKSATYTDNYCQHSHNYHKYRIPMTCSIFWYGFTDGFVSATINKNMKTYFKNSEFSDVKIRVNNNEEFPAHKIVLASNSPVFKKMLTTNMKESRENCINLPELDPDIANELLYYLYHGKFDKAASDFVMLSKLVEVAEMYCVSDLKSVCDSLLSINLSSENALAVLELSRAFDLINLQRQALLFIASNVDSLLPTKSEDP